MIMDAKGHDVQCKSVVQEMSRADPRPNLQPEGQESQ